VGYLAGIGQPARSIDRGTPARLILARLPGQLRRIKAFTQSYSDAGLGQSKLWPAGTVCITIAANIAASGILQFDACFPDSIVGLTPIDEDVGAYTEYFIRTARQNLDRFAPATAQKNINLDTLNALAVPLPPRTELKVILGRLDGALSAADLAAGEFEEALSQSARLQQSILATAFAGKLVPQDPKDEPAAELLSRLRAGKAAAGSSATISRLRRKDVHGRVNPGDSHDDRGGHAVPPFETPKSEAAE
jgi:type I restriction enzyme S subunit